MTMRIERHLVRTRPIRLDLRRALPAALLGGYGIFILSLLARHIMTLYINPTYIWPTTLAGAVLVGLCALRLTSKPSDGDACCATDACGCDEPSTKWWTYVALAFPLVLAAVFPPRSLAAFSALQRGVQVAGFGATHGVSAVKRVSLSVDTRTFSLQDWVGALSADPNPKDYMGKPIRLTGIVVHNTSMEPPGYLMVLRYQVTCCIADARPVGLMVRDVSHGKVRDNQWVTVIGKMGETSFQGQSLAVVMPKQILPAKAGDPYMY